jgi:rhamnosyltransferase
MSIEQTKLAAEMPICAIVVTYRPDPATISAVLDSLASQVAKVVVVDNASGEESVRELERLASQTGAGLICLPVNAGPAAGHNRGIRWALEHGQQYVLLLDQDSIPGRGMVAKLYAALKELGGQGPVAAVGPCFFDIRDRVPAPFVRFGFPLNRRYRCAQRDSQQYIRTDFLITSGSLISLSALEQVGAMNEALFIDNVDMEWCFRAKARGFSLFGVCGATMRHSLGERRKTIGGPLGGDIVVHTPLRLYYIMRNRILLYRMSHTPWIWILQDILRLPAKVLLFTVLVPPRLKNLQFMSKGLWHGLVGRSGAHE